MWRPLTSSLFRTCVDEAGWRGRHPDRTGLVAKKCKAVRFASLATQEAKIVSATFGPTIALEEIETQWLVGNRGRAPARPGRGPSTRRWLRLLAQDFPQTRRHPSCSQTSDGHPRWSDP